MTDDEQRDFDAAASQVTSLDEQITAAEAESQRTTTSSTAIERSEAAEIARACMDGGVPSMTASLLAEGVSLAVAKTRVGAASQIKELVTLAGKTDGTIKAELADEFIASSKTVAEVKSALFDRMAAKQDDNSVKSHVAQPQGNATPAAASSSMERELKRAGMKKEG